ncbi:Chromosome partition protein Smc [Carpediemonas membranifera]|uniref:Chromosome partition protein Smc n=1 Tax=Carpediemonas membranifera TaxID=201153 RepID=A0A8J6DZS8_9EUKA|nr:Chromosome partition protein Smc [Carpediemonas membranifera]|eukprot:KAG9390836.1 Chromosome partition protein Smc [Carpediemonas membranifera]
MHRMDDETDRAAEEAQYDRLALEDTAFNRNSTIPQEEISKLVFQAIRSLTNPEVDVTLMQSVITTLQNALADMKSEHDYLENLVRDVNAVDETNLQQQQTALSTDVSNTASLIPEMIKLREWIETVNKRVEEYNTVNDQEIEAAKQRIKASERELEDAKERMSTDNMDSVLDYASWLATWGRIKG